MAADVTITLRQTSLLGSIPEPDLVALAGVSRLRTVRKGQMVCTTGDPGDTLIVVITGRLRVVVRSADGGELVLTQIGPGGVIGEVSVADDGPRSADVETIENSSLLLIPRAAVQEACARVPAAAQALAIAIAGTLRRLTEATSDLAFLDLPRRVAKLLLSYSTDAHGLIQPQVTQGEIARQVGGARQSVNAALRAFEKRGWIALSGRSLTLKEPGQLARFAGD